MIRVEDYGYKIIKESNSHLLRIRGLKGNAYTAWRVAEEAGKALEAQPAQRYFFYLDGKKWKMVPTPYHSLIQRILHRIFPNNFYLASYYHTTWKVERVWDMQALFRKAAPAPPPSLPTNVSFQVAAAEAFQKYEPYMTAHDGRGAHDCLSYITHTSGKSPKGVYKNQLVEKYGEKAVDRVAAHCQVHLDGTKLTPEEVYRMEMGLTAVFKGDIDPSIREPKAFHEAVQQRRNDPKDCIGRRIDRPIVHEYTNAGWSEYKPWVDMQELYQLYDDLVGAKDWVAYMELLTHLVSKKHIAWETATGASTLGMLIPVFPGQEGIVRWYEVSGWVRNAHGIYSYTLKAACEDPSLPPLRLYRSTSSCAYAIDGQSSLINDVNPFGSPGYEGAYLTDGEERAFVEENTLPLWQAYALAAEKAGISTTKGMGYLTRALEERKRPPISLTLQQILRKHGALLHRLLITEHPACIVWLLRNVIFGGGYKEYLAKKQIEDLKKLLDNSPQSQALLRDLNSTNDFKEPEEISGDGQEVLKQLLGEIERKTERHFCFVGHSLGGGCAQRMMAQMVYWRRVPFPDSRCAGYFFDEPGINEEDAEAFRHFGADHKELFKDLAVQFSITRRHEASDFVPITGEAHLGSAPDVAAAQELQKWCTCDFKIQKIQEAHYPRSSWYAHGTLFEGASIKESQPFQPEELWTLDSGPAGRRRESGKEIALQKWKIQSVVWRLFNERWRTSTAFIPRMIRRAVGKVQKHSPQVAAQIS